jgi:hypothetical protein
VKLNPSKEAVSFDGVDSTWFRNRSAAHLAFDCFVFPLSWTPPVIYDGLVSYYNVSDADYFYVDAKISLGIGGITTFSHQLVDMAQVPVCNQFTANDYNMYGDCPADGRYSYEAQYNFPAPSSDLMSWATTGYEGDITLDIYLGNTELVGRCVIGAKTMVTGSYEKGTFESVPSGMIATIVVMSITLLLCMYIVCLLVKSCRSQRVENRKSLEAEPDEEPTSSYNRMVEAGVDEDITPASSAVSRADTRYSADGALI